ncbi:glutamate-cysteine ligase-domain-containing protein [Polychytrium aggregatum]|uniref:glutamate-cysteine ligase-domain-containing protein n=1 Tax=Polychytrium aggregatum TaxID=110093 RepID=UPI0022FEC655|nr:glutamate-cysteine ligase-domain-containing protein [Polychytrium aggregatum]KAI9206510.1 glutamate-cysteine ligase-domain-containing protein [Polychytrium aggregatum]
MGWLTAGAPLSWTDIKQHTSPVRKRGIAQLLALWDREKTRSNDPHLWGDEIEYIVVSKDDSTRKVRLSLRAQDALHKLEELEAEAQANGEAFASSWKPEYAGYMLESSPGSPYGSTLGDLTLVEPNMHKRRVLAQACLGPNETVLTMTSYPRLGTSGFMDPHVAPDPVNGAARSLFIPDAAITSHARYLALTTNIMHRRGSKVSINVPVFIDNETAWPFLEPIPHSATTLSPEDIPGLSAVSPARKTKTQSEHPMNLDGCTLSDLIPDALPNHIFMDCMAFGCSCCCLQATFQGESLKETRLLYDQLAVIAPIMLALSAAAPIFRGYLADVDCRWNVIAASVDDRTKEERGEEPQVSSQFYIPKSRYDSISLYLSPGPDYSAASTPSNRTAGGSTSSEDGCSMGDDTETLRPDCFFKHKYNDLNVPYDYETFRALQDGGLDEFMAKHYAHLFIRDPLILFEGSLETDDSDSVGYFEGLQSTNWQTIRFKAPTPGMPIGWRVEFRSMEVQLTDFENAAYAIFVALLTRVIISYDLNFYLPLSKVDENMQRAQTRAAVTQQAFWFRNNIFGGVPPPRFASFACTSEKDSDEARQLTINEIINGSGAFPGLVPIIESYLDSADLDSATRTELSAYLALIARRASGELMTAAGYIRKFVHEHPEYRNDSVVSDSIMWDLVQRLESMAESGGRSVPGLTA